jgi:hypothetical protein
MEFKKKNYLELKKMPLEEVRKYYMELRKYEYETDAPIKGLEIRKRTYLLIKYLLKLDKIFSLRTTKVIKDERINCNKQTIYATTHIGRYDIETSIERIGKQAWFIMGDPGETYCNIDGIILRINGVSWFEMGSDKDKKLDAHTVNVRQTKILSSGSNELCFPEAAWNLDPVLPVGEINPGVIKRAIITKANIVPIGIEQYRGKILKHYYINIGKNIDTSKYTIDDVDYLTKYLKEEMIRLKWEIWETYGKTKRKDLKAYDTEYQEFINSIMCDTENGYTIEEIERTKYKNPNKEKVPTSDEVFKHLGEITPNKNNYFLFKNMTEESRKRQAKVLKKEL